MKGEISVSDGLSGVGLAVDYLIKKGYIKGNTNTVLQEIDNLIFRQLAFDKYSKIYDINQLLPILYYLSVRWESQKKDSEAEYLFRELIKKTVNNLYSRTDFQKISEPLHYSLDYVIPQLFYVMGYVASLGFYKNRIEMIMDIAKRCDANPLLTPRDLKPGIKGMEITCLLNPGVFRYQGKIGLLLRVAERPIQQEGIISFPVYNKDGKIEVLSFSKDDPELDASDPRVIGYKGQNYLTTMSYLRFVFSQDGIHFKEYLEFPPIFGKGELESFGIEDCRVATCKDGFYMRKYLVLLILFLFVDATTFAQQMKRISGLVTDQNTGEALIGASVVETGTSNGTITDIDGKYSLSITSEQVSFSYVGYESQIIKVGQSETVNVKLASNNKLEEVVVIGYGTQKKSDLTGSLASINSKDIKNYAVSNASELLSGKAAGVFVASSSGQPGSDAVIRVRGLGTVNDNNPLYVVDGQFMDVWMISYNIRLIRYSDVLLMYAEALNENGKAAAALPYLNEVRERARNSNPVDPRRDRQTYIPPTTGNTLKNITETGQDQLRKLIWHERRCELAMEGWRRDDLMRQKRFGTVMRSYASTYNTTKGANFDDNRDYLLPIPQGERDKSNDILTQNPGY